jgi:hypothetical protein
LFIVPQYLQSVLGEDPISAGLRLLPLMGGLLVAGGAAIAVAMDAVMAAAGGDEAGAGASVNSTLRQVGGAIAVTVLGSVLSGSYARHLQPALARLPAADAAAARASISQAAQVAGRLPAGSALSTVLRAAAGTAFLDGMSIVMLICAAVTALAAVTSLRYLRR